MRPGSPGGVLPSGPDLASATTRPESPMTIVRPVSATPLEAVGAGSVIPW